MKLTLDRGDLRPKYRFLDTTKIEFGHLNKEAQEMFLVTGGALLERRDGSFISIKKRFPEGPAGSLGKTGQEPVVKPIKPEDVEVAPVPNEVIQVFNDLIQKHWDGKEAIIEQGEVLLAVCLAMGISKDEVFDKKLLDVEKVFRQAGWKVTYNKPSPLRDESYSAFFAFSKLE